MFDAIDFIAELTQHIPPKGLQLIRRYGLYASRTKGRWKDMPWVSERAPEGWKRSHLNDVSPVSDERTSFPEDEVEVDILAYKRAWARLLSKVYEIDPLACPKCGAEMKCRDRSSATPAVRPWMSLQLSRTQMRLSEYSDIW
jgi:hypothetical protein